MAGGSEPPRGSWWRGRLLCRPQAAEVRDLSCLVEDILLQLAGLQDMVRGLHNARETEKELDSWAQAQPWSKSLKLPHQHTQKGGRGPVIQKNGRLKQ